MAMPNPRESHYYFQKNPLKNKLPNKLVERLHRWRFRKLYVLLPEFYQDFYPFHFALSLTLSSMRHDVYCAEQTAAHGQKCIDKTIQLEKELCQTRLALANAQLGWNEDRVDKFMSQWFVPVKKPDEEA